MGTDPSDAEAWPWAALGIAPTADKAAIHAAHDARRAELDAASARISDFADLTAARGKALFLAAEMQRQSAREGTATLEVDAPVRTETPPEPEPEPEPHRGATDWEPGGRFSSATDGLVHLGEYMEHRGHAGMFPAPPPREPDDVETRDWEHGGGYKPDIPTDNADLAEELARIAGLDPSQRNDADGSWSGPGPTPFLERYSLDRYGFFWLLGILLLLGFCSGR